MVNSQISTYCRHQSWTNNTDGANIDLIHLDFAFWSTSLLVLTDHLSLPSTHTRSFGRIHEDPSPTDLCYPGQESRRNIGVGFLRQASEPSQEGDFSDHRLHDVAVKIGNPEGKEIRKGRHQFKTLHQTLKHDPEQSQLPHFRSQAPFDRSPFGTARRLILSAMSASSLFGFAIPLAQLDRGEVNTHLSCLDVAEAQRNRVSSCANPSLAYQSSITTFIITLHLSTQSQNLTINFRQTTRLTLVELPKQSLTSVLPSLDFFASIVSLIFYLTRTHTPLSTDFTWLITNTRGPTLTNLLVIILSYLLDVHESGGNRL
ncbi:hypothetical protein CROQUDRAFT_86505 [Cronartium quercuum f. sp. fusiforme G11]|uniref:Uncharacterized protein n=1 Tax=Cronartium quercuum f. sp. fusiforme G11 TaxID=708437 RepID=A0A9P6TGI0_9BASI|nr:hypothetical protein CROQUDRAFT_86505 [Cronartium quercuum f. sp. fusiforme G11]